MTQEWKQYLQQLGAQFANDTVLHFGNPQEELRQALHNNIITDLSQFGLIKVSGNDAEKFLQGQFTNDVRQVTESSNQLSAWCSPKGRIIVNFRQFKRDNAYYLLLPKDSVTTTFKRLQMYVLRANVKIEDASNHLVRIGIAGTKTPQLLTECLGFEPSLSPNTSLTTNQTTVLNIPGLQPRYIVFTETPQIFWECLQKTTHSVGINAWQFLEILAGLPQILPATAEEFVPQMVNYQLINGVSFKKGCYPGQEIVARMQYLGSLKRRMYLAKIDAATIPQAGDSLYVSTEEQTVGKIVNATAHPDGGAIVLAVISIDSVNTSEIHWLNQQGECLQFLELPYSLQN